MKTVFIAKRISCYYLCISVLLLGTITLLPTIANAKMVKRTPTAQQISPEEIQRYQNKDNAEIETMFAGKSVNSDVWGCIGVIGILIVAVIAAGSA